MRQMKGKVLVINTGSTSTKVGYYVDGQPVCTRTLEHTAEETGRYADVLDQDRMRRDAVTAFLNEKGIRPTLLLGGKSAADLLRLTDYQKLGETFVTTEDGSLGEKGFVTMHSVWQKQSLDKIYVCGPKPMMKAVAKLAAEKNVWCEVSLENLMACGLGACLCCVEDTVDGHVCVCKEGPVFNRRRLKW